MDSTIKTVDAATVDAALNTLADEIIASQTGAVLNFQAPIKEIDAAVMDKLPPFRT